MVPLFEATVFVGIIVTHMTDRTPDCFSNALVKFCFSKTRPGRKSEILPEPTRFVCLDLCENMGSPLASVSPKRNTFQPLHGNGMERKWKGNEKDMERKWKGNGKEMERKWKGNGMERKSKGNRKDMARTWKGNEKGNGKEMERIWRGNGQKMERKWKGNGMERK